MDKYVVEVVGRRFFMDERSVSYVREQVVRAVRVGGEFVTFGSGESRRDVLISPGLPVVIQRRSEPIGTPEEEGAGASTMEPFIAPADQFDDWGI